MSAQFPRWIQRCSMIAGALGALLFLGAPREAASQQVRIDVLIQQIAGANLYLSAGSTSGIGVNDTLQAYDAADETRLGILRVIGISRESSVVEFVGAPFPATRGERLIIELGGPPSGGRGSQGAEGRYVPARAARERHGAGESATRHGAARRLPPRMTGSLSLGVDGLQLTTKMQSFGLTSFGRGFTTPAARLRLQITNLPGGLEIGTNLRAAYRYSTNHLVQPARSTDIYSLSLVKSFQRAPLSFRLGRFYNRYESFSGYFDGLLIHYGDRGLGVGIAAGYQPDRASQDFSTRMPKYTAFVNYQGGSGPVRYRSDVSFHQLRPTNGLPDHTYVGVSQDLLLAGARIGQSLQMDRNPATHTWSVSRLLLDAAFPLGKRVDLHARYGRRQPYDELTPTDSTSFRTDRGGAGFSYRFRGGTVGGEVALSSTRGGEIGTTYSGYFSVPQTALAGLGIAGSASYWTRGQDQSLQLSPAITASTGRAFWRVGYNFYRTQDLGLDVRTHSLDLSLRAPLARGLNASLQLRPTWGSTQTGGSFHAGLWMAF